MLTLCIDTAYKYLTCALIQDNHIIGSYCKECFKKQSEEVFLALDETFKQANVERKDIDSICISEGPGSYTGVRIAMTIAKTIGELLKIDVYTSPITALEIKKILEEEQIEGINIHIVKRHDQKRIGKHKVLFFPVTHSYPQCFCVAISTSQGYIVYSG